MKRNLLVLAIILLIGFIVNSCGGDEENECSICKNGQHCYTHCVNENCNVHDCKNHNKNECPICNPICDLGEHLGVGETCNGINCTLKDYRTVDMKNESHNDYFQWPIYRVGALSNYGENDLTTTVGNILTGYKGLNPLIELVNLKNSSLEQVHITYNAPSGLLEAVFGKYTWDGTILGIQKGNASNFIKECLIDISNDALWYAQLQPASDIRLVDGKRSTEQFQIITDYINILTYATVVYIKI